MYYFLKIKKKRRQFRSISLLRSSKKVHLDGKNVAFFTQNLVQNLINLVLRSKSDKKLQKIGKTKTVSKTTYVFHSPFKG